MSYVQVLIDDGNNKFINQIFWLILFIIGGFIDILLIYIKILPTSYGI